MKPSQEEKLRALCFAAYQIVGTVAHEQGGDDPNDPHWPGRFEPLMDWLAKAGNGEPIEGDPVDALLPFPALDGMPHVVGQRAEGVRILPAAEPRAETGTVQFGAEDWPGLFIRGKHAFFYACALYGALPRLEALQTDLAQRGAQNAEEAMKLRLEISALKGLLKALQSTHAKPRTAP